ncbi:flavin reductase family protein [Subtercola lobariae]|uniref:Flavin reductase n=1 Tax=Subtercola lobariae TaxID=1588641 RepID=A0A917BA59_9MICO|nr:flavin reductase family protein [Subtercola lobariae]GGF31723.1 flavin reductase [Subtercola lobariae]
MEPRQSVSAQLFRDMMAGVCAPVTVVTTANDGVPVGTTVSSFASLSLDPPLVTVAFDRASKALEAIRVAGSFGINLLGHAQADLARLFATREVDRFAQTEWHFENGLPRLAGAAGWLECDVYDAVEGGDHILLIGHVVDASHAELPPLVYAYRTFGTHSHYDKRQRPEIIDTIAALSR